MEREVKMSVRTRIRGLAGATVMGLMAATAVQAAGNGWRFFTAATYRVIDDVDFSRAPLVNPAYAPATDGVNQYQFVNGTFDLNAGTFQIANAAQYDPIGWVPATPGPFGVSQTSVFLDQVTAGSQNTDFHHGTAGVVLGVEKPWRMEGGLELSFRASFWYAADDIDEAAALNTQTTELSIGLVDGGDGVITNPTPLSDSAAGGDDFVFANAAGPGGTATTTAVAIRSLDMDLYVLSAGLSGKYDLGKGFSLRCGTGPTLNLSRVETRLGAQTTVGGVAGASWKQTDADTDLAFGWYGRLGLEYQATERVSLGLDWRYDWVFQDVGTDQATIDLDGQSLAISLTVAF